MFSRSIGIRTIARSLNGGLANRCEKCLHHPRTTIPSFSKSIRSPTTSSSIRRYASISPSFPPPSPSILPKRENRKSKQPSHKPPKRRLEAASQPLRNAPSVTRGPILQCVAHTTAEQYDLYKLGNVLRSIGVKWDEVPEGDRDRAFVIGPWKGRGGAERLISGKDVRHTAWSPNGNISELSGVEEEMEDEYNREQGFGYGDRGEIWVFNSGSFVTWGLTEEEGRAFLRTVIRKKGAGVERGGLASSEYEVEEVDFVVDPTAETNILGNLILLGAPPTLSTFPTSPSLSSLLTRYTLSLALTRSSTLSVLEDRLDAHIASVSTLPLALSKYGAQPMNRRDVIRKIGELMALRMAVNTSGGGLDETPEFYWSEPALEEYFDTITSEFEIKERIETINKKIDYAQEVQTTLRALLTEASGHRMEVIIIVLIAVEVVLALIREGPDLAELVIMPAVGSIGQLLGIQSKSKTKEGHSERAEDWGHAHGHGHGHGEVVGWERHRRDRAERAEPILAGEIGHLGRFTRDHTTELSPVGEDGWKGWVSPGQAGPRLV